MSNVRVRDTKPEIVVRRILHRSGYRFRLHRRDLPGRPDIILPKYKTVIFVHGCFWHQHEGCSKAQRPKSNWEFWNSKLDANIARDRRNQSDLEKLGWRVLVVWECEASRTGDLSEKLSRGLRETGPQLQSSEGRNIH